MYLSPIENEETLHNAFLYMSDCSQPPRDLCKDAVFHVWTYPCVHRFRWRTFWALVNFGLINS